MRQRWSTIVACWAWALCAGLATAQAYTLKVSLLGLVGYVNTSNEVWALLPDASGKLPPGVKDDQMYPRHFAYLKVSGQYLRGTNMPQVPGQLLIPIVGYDVVPQLADFATGNGLDAQLFAQPLEAELAAMDQLAAGVTDTPPQAGDLAARFRLPRAGLWPVRGNVTFAFVTPKPPTSENICLESTDLPGSGTSLVEAVEWKVDLTQDIVLDFLSHKDPASNFSLVLGPPPGSSLVEFEVVNQVSMALVSPATEDEQFAHFPPYRWYYSLSAKSDPSHCGHHYYPEPTTTGGQRCPQKIYSP